MRSSSQTGTYWNPIPDHPVGESLAIAVIVLVACVFGIQTRTLFELASLWPANAILLTLFVMRPGANRPLTWIASALAYVTADLFGGSDFVSATMLSGANLAGVAAGVLAVQFAASQLFPLRRPAGVVFLVLCIAAASAVSGVVGALVGPLLFGMTASDGFYFWFSTEFVNYAIFFPPVVGIAMHVQDRFRVFSRRRNMVLRQVAALVTLVVSCALMAISGGPGLFILPLPALLWCAIRFRPVISTALTGITCVWIMLAVPHRIIPLHIDLASQADITSLRIGVAILSISAFAVAAINAAWRMSHVALHYAATHDPLTGVANRGDFIARAQRALDNAKTDGPFCLLMIDIDHFKQVNDTYGHPAGDVVIREVAILLSSKVRQNDILGRIGGEEFSIALPGCNLLHAQLTAERIREAVSNMVLNLDGQAIRTTVSIGVANRGAYGDLGFMMSVADEALYCAKRDGRNKVFTAQTPPLPTRPHA